MSEKSTDFFSLYGFFLQCLYGFLRKSSGNTGNEQYLVPGKSGYHVLRGYLVRVGTGYCRVPSKRGDQVLGNLVRGVTSYQVPGVPSKSGDWLPGGTQ